MNVPEEGVLLRVIVGESDQWEGKPVYEQIVLKARELHLAGATVTRGIMGFGGASRIHTTRLLRLSEDLPVVVEIVDRAERLDLMLSFLDEIVDGGIVTMEAVRVLRYQARSQNR